MRLGQKMIDLLHRVYGTYELPKEAPGQDLGRTEVQRGAGDLGGSGSSLDNLRPASRAHLALEAAVLQCLESDVYPETIVRFVHESLAGVGRATQSQPESGSEPVERLRLALHAQGWEVGQDPDIGPEAESVRSILAAALREAGIVPESGSGGEGEGAALIAAERARQVEQEGWTPEHDRQHEDGELVDAAKCYLDPGGFVDTPGIAAPGDWPWDAGFWKPVASDGGPESLGVVTREDRVRNLTKAGALIAAEIDRLTCANPVSAPTPTEEPEVERFRFPVGGGERPFTDECNRERHDDGPYVRFTDHQAQLAEKDREIERLRARADELKRYRDITEEAERTGRRLLAEATDWGRQAQERAEQAERGQKEATVRWAEERDRANKAERERDDYDRHVAGLQAQHSPEDSQSSPDKGSGVVAEGQDAQSAQHSPEEGEPVSADEVRGILKGRESLWEAEGCPETVWDGPYSYQCGKGADSGVCATHGRFGQPPAPKCDGSGRLAVIGSGHDCPGCPACQPTDTASHGLSVSDQFPEARQALADFDSCGDYEAPIAVLRQIVSGPVSGLSDEDRKLLRRIAYWISHASVTPDDFWDCAATDLRTLANKTPEPEEGESDE